MCQHYLPSSAILCVCVNTQLLRELILFKAEQISFLPSHSGWQNLFENAKKIFVNEKKITPFWTKNVRYEFYMHIKSCKFGYFYVPCWPVHTPVTKFEASKFVIECQEPTDRKHLLDAEFPQPKGDCVKRSMRVY